MATLEELRGKLPELSGLDDEHAIEFIRRVYYPDRQPAEIAASLGYKPPPPEVKARNGFAVTNDTVIDFANAAAGGIGAAANFVSPGNRVSKYIDENIVAAGKASQSDATRAEDARYAAEMEAAQGFGDEVGTTLGYVARNPLRSVAQAAGSFVGPGASVKGMQLAARGAGAGAAGVTRAGLVGGAMAGGAMAGGDAAGTAYELAIKAGATEEQATDAARQASMIPGAIGAAGGLVGAERVFAGGKGFAGGRLSRALKTGAVEAGQEGIEEGVTQYEGQRAAIPFDPNIDPMKGVGGAATMGAVLGGITGGSLAAMSPGDQLRTEGLQPETGPFTRGSNKAVEAAAAIADASAPAMTGYLNGDWRINPPAQAPAGGDAGAPAGVTASLQAPAGSAQPEAKTTITDPVFGDRVLTLREQLADEGLRTAIREKVGEQALNEAVYYANLADRSEQAGNKIPDKLRDRFLSLAEAIVSRAIAQPTDRPGMGAPAAAAQLGAAPGPLQIALDTAPTGVMRVGPDGRAAPETAADAINTRNATAQPGDEKPASRIGSAIQTEETNRQQRIADIQAAPVERVPRTRSASAAQGAQAPRNAAQGAQADLVQTYVDQRRDDGTPAGRAFAQDFDAGRITRADVQGLIDTARPQSADDRLAAAAAQAPKPQALQPGDLLNPKGEPFRNQRAATTVAQREGGSVIVVDGGWAVRKATDAPATAAAAGPRDADGERSTRTGVLRDQRPADLPVSTERPADEGAEQPAAAVVRAGRAAEPSTALSPDADLPTLKKAWSEAAAAGDTERAREINDRIVAKKKAPGTAVAAPSGAVVPAGLNVTFGGKTYPVESVEDAQRKWIKFQESAADGGPAGVSQVGNGIPVNDGAGRLVARVAYNGRAFDPQDNLIAEAPAAPKAAQVESDSTPSASSTGQAPVKQPAVKGSKKAAEIKAKRAAKLNPAPAAPESAAATTEGAANGDQAQAQAKRVLDQGADGITSAPVAPFEHAGLKVYPTKVRRDGQLVDRWAVQLPENKGTDKVLGDTLHATVEEAKKSAEYEARRDEDRTKRERAETEAAAERAAKVDANRGKSVLERRADAILDKPTTLPASAGLGTGSRRQAMQKAVDEGRAIVEAKVLDSAAKKRDQDAVADANKAGYILGLSNANLPVVKAALEARDRLKANKYETKPEYRVYSGRRQEGGFFEITKTEYDYAQNLMAEPASQPEPETVAPATAAQSQADPVATHKDPGEPAEPVTPAVVAEAITTAARAEERTRSEMKAEALRLIDAAIAKAPSSAEIDAMMNVRDPITERGKKVMTGFRGFSADRNAGDGIVVSARETSDGKWSVTNESYDGSGTGRKVGTKIGELAGTPAVAREQLRSLLYRLQPDGTLAEPDMVIIKVPGDGEFTVMNTKERLADFRKKVEASPGFKDRQPTATASSRTNYVGEKYGAESGSGPKLEAFSNMVDEGDMQAALDYAEAVGIDPKTAKLSDMLRKRLDKWMRDTEMAAKVAEREAATAEPAPKPKAGTYPAEDVFNVYRKAESAARGLWSSSAARAHDGKLNRGLTDLGVKSTTAQRIIEQAKTIHAQRTRGATTITFISPQDFMEGARRAGIVADAAPSPVAAPAPAPAVEAPAAAAVPEPATADDEAPQLSEAQARKQFEWRDMGQSGGTKTHRLFFYVKPEDKGTGRAMGRGYVELYEGSSGWRVDGEGESYKALSDAKAAAVEAAIPVLRKQGWIAPESAAEQPVKLKYPATVQGAIDAFNADDSAQAMLVIAKLKIDDLKEVGAAVGFRPQINETAKAFRERIGEVADKLTKTAREKSARQKSMYDKLIDRAMDYDRAADHMANSLRLGNAVDSEANTTSYKPMDGGESKWMPIPEALDKLAADVASLRNDPEYAEVAPMVSTKRPRVFDHEATPKQAEPEKAVEPAARLTDAGEELIRNRRGKLKGLAWGDVSAMNDTLKVAQVVKSNVWPRPDYAKMVEEGAPAWKAAALKAVYDKLSAAPVTRAAPTDADLKDYIETMHLVRDVLMAELDRVAALPDGNELWKTLQARNVFGKVFPVPSDARPVYGAPSAFDRSSEQGKTNNRRALLIGGNAAVHALQFGYKMTSKVKDLVAEGFPAKQESWQKSYEVRQTETRDNDVPEAERTGHPQQRFYVYEKGSRYRLAKGGQDGGYGTQEQAEAFARSLTTKKREVLPPSRGLDLAEAKRTGPDWRNGKDVNAQDIMDRFGFRGVNLGEYVKAKQGMAQLHLNHVFDAFSDLADLLGVPPKAMSLNGTLGVAIGAQGSGKALAHFVPGVNEINITRDSGAGALAHEFGHAVDHYFATQHGRAVSMAKRPYLSAVVEGSTDSGDVRPEVMDAMRAVMKTLNARPMTEAEARKFLAEQRELNQRRMDRWVKEFSGNKGADPAALAAVAEKLKRGDLGAPQDADVEANLSEFMRAAGLKPGNAIAANAFSLAYRLRDLADETRFLARHIPQVDTDYAKASAAMDAKKTGDGYWSTPWEKFARAFETFAMDALKDRQRESLYLSGLVDSEGWRSWASETGKAIPYPAGDERLAMQQAFQKLVDTIDTRADDAGNVAMYSRTRGRGISTRDAKAVVATIRSALPNAPDIVLHETVAQAPEGLQDKIREEGAEDDVEAVYWNGEIHAFPKHMESVERALFVIGRHEVRHHGMRTRYGKKLDETLMAMWRGNQALRQATQAIIDGGRARASERLLAIEEALADLPVAEIAKLKGFDRFVAAMRDWLRMTAKRLRAGGFGLLADAIEPKTWTDADVAAFVLKAEQVSGKGGTGGAFSRPQGEAAPFYSALERSVTASPMKSAPVDGWRQFFKSQVAKGTVKADELEWTGVSDWLDLQQGKVSREAVLDYLAANGVQVTETVLRNKLAGAESGELDAATAAFAATGWTYEVNYDDQLDSIIAPDGTVYGAYDGGRTVQWLDEDEEVADLPANVVAAAQRLGEAIENATRAAERGPGPGVSKYDQYTLPGGTNYREVLLTLPEKPGERGPKGWGSTAGATADTTNYRSGHWDQANILAHIRLNDRTDADGKRVLFVEEIQSDWAQEGKKKGFKDDARRAVVRAELEALRAKYGGDIRKAGGVDAARHAELLPEFDRLGGALPAAPFVGKTDAWVALAIKRVIGIAAREGYDRVAFVNGQQSAERYDLSKHVDQLTYGDDGVLRAFQGRKNVMSEKVAPEKIEDYIGKEVAKRLLDAPMEDGRRVLMGESLRIGGEGMQAFYDKIVPAVAKDVLRKVGGGQMGAVQIGAQREISTNVDDGAGGVIKRRESIGTTLTQPGFDITPTMREKAAAGLPLFSRRPDTMAPAVTVDRDADTGAPVYATDDITIGFPQKTERFEYLGGQNLINYSIGPADGFDSYGMVELEIGPDGVPIGLADIEIKPEYRGRDIGAKVVEAILAAHPGLDLDISNIVEGARGFWSRLGIPEQNRASGEAYDGTLNWQTFSQAQNARRADRAGARGRAAGEGRNAGAEGSAPGADGQAPGQAQGGVARFSRATGMAEPWADKALSAADTMAGLISKPESIVGQTKREYTPEQSAAMKQVGFQVEPQKPSERIKALMQDAGKKIAQGVFDQFAPVKELSEKAYMLLRLSKGASGAFEALLKGGKLKITDGVYDFDEKNRGGVIKQLLTPLQGEHHDFLRWVAANRAERLAGEGKENLFTPESIAALKSLSDGVTSFDYTIQTGEGKGTVTRDRTLIYADAQRIFNGFHRNVMDMAEQSGLIDAEAREMWEHEFYVPFFRVEDDGSVAGANIKNGVIRQQAFKALTGRSNKLNADLLDNTLMNWAHLLDAAAKNRAAKASIEAAESAKVALPIEGNMGKGSVWFMENGQKRWSFVDDPYLMTAISALQYGGLKGPAMQALSSLKHMLTIGVTASPFFKVRNLIRDSVQVIASSPIGVNPVANVVQGWKNTSPESDQYFRLLAGGGTIHFGTMMEGSEAKRVQALVESGVDASNILDSDKKVKAFYRKFIEPGITAYNELGNRGEAVNRAALYSQLIDQGVSHAEASLLARDLMDFSMGGSFASIRFLTQVVPFFNARLQGLYKLGRAAKEDPKRFSQVLGTVALISLGLLAAYGDDDDWKKREEWDRNNYWWFKFGGTAIRIPKPFEIGAIATLAERSAEYLMDDEMNGKRFRAQLLALLGDNLSMNPIPQAVKPMLDVYANKDSFSGRPIETMGMGRLKPEYRVRGDTSMAARGISSAANAATGLVGKEALSPVQIDHLIRGYFGWLGMFVVSASDIVARPATGQTDRPAPDYWKRATGGMVADLSDAPSRYVSQVYEQAKEIEQAYGTWRDLQKQGRREEADEFRRENTAAIMGYKTVERAKARMAHLNAEIRRIEKSEMGADEKRDAMRPIRTEQDALARRVPVLN